MKEIKNCPFCGGKAITMIDDAVVYTEQNGGTQFIYSIIENKYKVGCPSCNVWVAAKSNIRQGADGEVRILSKGLDEAIDKWNRRV